MPLALADHLSPMVRDVFDGEVVKGYSCACTKTTAILNNAVAPAFKSELVTVMQKKPFTIAIDGSNDNGLCEMNPITVKIFDSSREKVVTHFLDMCTTTGASSATAEAIFSKMDQVMLSCEVPWNDCVGVGVDNTSVNRITPSKQGCNEPTQPSISWGVHATLHITQLMLLPILSTVLLGLTLKKWRLTCSIGLTRAPSERAYSMTTVASVMSPTSKSSSMCQQGGSALQQL